jgi:hypothetical protein
MLFSPQILSRSQSRKVSGGGGSPVTIFITSGTSWSVPSDWNNSNNTIEGIGGGGGRRAAEHHSGDVHAMTEMTGFRSANVELGRTRSAARLVS